MEVMKKKMMREIMLAVTLKKEETGYSALCPELGVASQGENVEEALDNIKEAVELYLESSEEAGIKEHLLEKLGVHKKAKSKSYAESLITANVPIEISA